MGKVLGRSRVGVPTGRRVESGEAHVLIDLDRPSGRVLVVDGVRQSYVDLDDPTYLDFEYMDMAATVIAAVPPGPLRVVHVGGAAMTLPRYVAAVRPGSRQIVFESDGALRALVAEALPLPKRSGIRVRTEDGLAGVRNLPSESADIVILDAFVDGRVPAELTTDVALRQFARVLTPNGVLIVNVADGRGLTYTRRLARTAAQEVGDVAVISDHGVFKGRRFGNLIVVAGRGGLPELDRAVAASVLPRGVVSGADLRAFIASAAPLTVESSMQSPEPPSDQLGVS